MKKQNYDLKKYFMRIVILLFMICISMVFNSPRITQAKEKYSSAKEVKKEIKKINKKISKATRASKKAKAKYKSLAAKDKKETAGSHLLFLAKIENTNPFIVSTGGHYYRVKKPSNGTTLLGHYTASVRFSGGSTYYFGVSCTNVTAVKSSVDAKLTKAHKEMNRQESLRKRLIKKRNKLKKTLTYRVPRKDCTIDAGETFSLKYFCDDSYYNEVKWKSSNTSVVTIKKGKVKALRPGKVTITAKTSISKKTTKISVTVNDFKEFPLEYSYMSIAVGKKAELWVARDGDCCDKVYSSNDNIVSIQNNGGSIITLKAKSVGTAVITAISSDNEIGTCTVEVFEPTFKTDLTSQPKVINTENLPATYTVSFQSNLAKSDIQWPSGVTVNYDKKISDNTLVNGTLVFTFDEYSYNEEPYYDSISYDYEVICSFEFVVKQGPATSTDPTNPPIYSDKNEEDVVALTALIAEHQGRGAEVSEDLDSDCYTWEDGRLTGIDWTFCDLSGELDVSAFMALKKLFCYENQLSHLEVSNNVNLTTLYCDNNQLRSLDVTENINLKELSCHNNLIVDLDLFNNENLSRLTCDEGVTVMGYNGETIYY